MAVAARLSALAALCLAVQVASAALLAPERGSPNAATVLAATLVETGEYAARAWPTRHPDDPGVPGPALRAYLLPAEPLYIAAALAWLPGWLLPFLHAPIVALYATAIAACGVLLGGWRVGLLAGLLAALDPFVVVHGPVWDDTFLAAALEWAVFAALLAASAGWRLGPARPSRGSRVAVLGFVLLASAAASLARMPSQVTLLAVGLALAVRPSWRLARPAALAAATGVVIALAGWGLRNDAVLGTVFLGTSHDGITLFESNSEVARRSILETGTAEGYAASALAPHYAAVATLPEIEADAHFRRAAWSEVRRRPLDAAATSLLKIVVSVIGIDFGDAWISPRNVVAVGWNVALWMLAFAGLLRWRRAGAGPVVLLAAVMASLIAAITLGILAAGPVGLRYRMSLAGIGYILAGYALTSRAGAPSGTRDQIERPDGDN